MTASPPGPPVLDRVRERPGGRSERVRVAVLTAAREELLENGWDAFSHRATARRAGVDPATVYRRWPTRPRLAVDALLEMAGNAAPVPDTGVLREDLSRFLGSIREILHSARLLRLFHALSIATATDDEELREMVRGFWSSRFEQAGKMIERGIERGELPAGVDANRIIEQLVSPLYFRALVSGEPLEEGLIDRSIEAVVAAAPAFPSRSTQS